MTRKTTMIPRLIIAAATALLVAGSAFAQSSAPPAPNPPVEQSPTVVSSPTANGIMVAKSADVAVRFGSAEPADIMSSNLVGIDVYSKQNDKLGKVEDLAIAGGKTIKGLVVSVGGFLGVGEKYVLIDPAAVVVNEQDGKWKAFVDMSKDALKSAPEFKYSKGRS
jgi:sporulation protein YlmC with PRC-barrel domain